MRVPTSVQAQLEYLRHELREQRLSWGDLADLQSLADFIDVNDAELLEAAGVPEVHEADEDVRCWECRQDFAALLG